MSTKATEVQRRREPRVEACCRQETENLYLYIHTCWGGGPEPRVSFSLDLRKVSLVSRNCSSVLSDQPLFFTALFCVPIFCFPSLSFLVYCWFCFLKNSLFLYEEGARGTAHMCVCGCHWIIFRSQFFPCGFWGSNLGFLAGQKLSFLPHATVWLISILVFQTDVTLTHIGPKLSMEPRMVWNL